MAEFLFTGETRISYFRHLHSQYPTGTKESHAQWGRAVDILLGDQKDQDWDQTFVAVLEKRKLPEDKKIKMIKDAMEGAKSSPKL